LNSKKYGQKSEGDKLNLAMADERGRRNPSKWEHLYSLAAKKKDRTNKDKDDIEYSKNPEEYTF